MWAGITTWEKLKLCWMLVRETLLIPSGSALLPLCDEPDGELPAAELNEMVESLKQTDAMTMVPLHSSSFLSPSRPLPSCSPGRDGAGIEVSGAD